MNLFDPATTVPTVCEVCGAVREPGEARAALCLNDQDKASGDYRPRPRQCLNAWNPQPNDPIPF